MRVSSNELQFAHALVQAWVTGVRAHSGKALALDQSVQDLFNDLLGLALRLSRTCVPNMRTKAPWLKLSGCSAAAMPEQLVVAPLPAWLAQ